jgi:hypothetical protein
MAIIINEFEVVSPPPNGEGQAASTERPSERQEVAQPMRPEDLDLIVRRFIQRRLRLWAD